MDRERLKCFAQTEKWDLLAARKGVQFFVIWIALGALIGLVVGVIGSVFHLGLEYVTEYRTIHPNVIFLLPVGGLGIVWLYRAADMERNGGTNFVLTAARTKGRITGKMAPLIFISTLITHLFGGSAGREGAALQLGGSVASQIGEWIHLNEKDERIIIMCGMSAGFSSLFGTPVTAVIFAIEVVTVGVMHYSAIVPCTVSSLLAAGISSLMGNQPTAFALMDIPSSFSLDMMLKVGLLGVLCGMVSVLFCFVMEETAKQYRRRLSNTYLRIFVGGCIVIGLTYLVGCRDYNGAGIDVIQKAISGDVKTEAFLWKIIFTALTLGAGYKGGEIVPAFFIGATFGGVAGSWIGLPVSFAAGTGLAAVFCGVTNCPLTSVVLCMELFGIEGIGYYLLACAVSYMLSGYYGLYSGQKILYSKYKTEKIDRQVNH